MANINKILLSMVLTGACQAVFAQSQMTIPRILESQTITTPDGTIQSINVELNPFDVQSANDSVELLHQRMGTNLSYGSLSGMSDGVTVQSYITSYGTLNVTGAAALGSTLDVSGATIVGGTVDVTGATALSSTLDVSGATTVGGTMDVTGATALSNTLDVSGATTVGGTMDVTGATTLGSSLAVTGATVIGGPTAVGSTMNVTGATALGNSLNVSGATTVGGTMNVAGASTLNGQVTINGNAASSYSATDQSPALVIDLAGIKPHRNSNFIQFEGNDVDGNPTVLGRVEGQYMDQEWLGYVDAFTNLLQCGAGLVNPLNGFGISATSASAYQDSSFNEISAISNTIGFNVTSSEVSALTQAFNNLLDTFDTDFGIGLIQNSISVVTNAISAVVEIWGVICLTVGADDLATTLMDIIDCSSNLGLHIYSGYGWVGMEQGLLGLPSTLGIGSGGIAFESVGADYAEWLQKSNPSDIFVPGDVLGVSAGQVGKDLLKPERYMVVSSNPTVIGAMPNEGESSHYTKIAFMGQVPTKVLGEVKRGDFILPSGNNDGYAVGVHPSEMETNDYKWIIGTAWSESQPGALASIVNVAVGLQENGIALQVEKMESTLANIEQALARLDPAYTPSSKPANSKPRIASNTIKSQRIQALVANNPLEGSAEKKAEQITGIFNNAQVFALQSGVDLNEIPFLSEVFADPLNINLREEAVEKLKERAATLQFVHTELKRRVQEQATANKTERQDKAGGAIDPYILLKSIQ